MQHKGLVCAFATGVAVATVAALALAVPAAVTSRVAVSTPADRLFVPGTSLGGVRLGMTKAEVLRAWRKRHGVCRDCRRSTWYFNDRPFEPEGTGVVFERGRVTQLFTLWQPDGWRTPSGIALGGDPETVRESYPAVEERACEGYTALVVRGALADSVFYVYRDELWAFGLTVPDGQRCV
jgi:hypothetical protein